MATLSPVSRIPGPLNAMSTAPGKKPSMYMELDSPKMTAPIENVMPQRKLVVLGPKISRRNPQTSDEPVDATDAAVNIQFRRNV